MARARELDEDAEILLVERKTPVSYATCGLAYHLIGEVASIEALERERADFFAAFCGVDVRTRAKQWPSIPRAAP